jgi:hypothetical protein
MPKLKTVDDLYNHIGYVVLCAPDKFPMRDYLNPEDQMNLDRAFEQLRAGIEIAYPEEFHPEKRHPLHNLLDQALAAYKAGDRFKGAHLLQGFQDSIFKSS